jgi:outer membrane protein assembly factor BamD
MINLLFNNKTIWFWIQISLLVYLSVSCSQTEPKNVEQRYDKAIQYIDRGLFGSAIPLLDDIINQNPGTRFAIYSYLKRGDALMDSNSSKLDEAETNYRIFLSLSAHSHLVPYVLSRLIELNYKKKQSSLFGKEYNYSRDPERFKKVISEYQRFFLLYPNSLYLVDAKEYLNLSTEALAEHELIIGDWYYKNGLFGSAIARYSYVINHYPNFKDSEKIVNKLIEAYLKNQQPQLASELKTLREKS